MVSLRSIRLPFAASISVLAAAQTTAAIRYVDATSPGGDGISWASAYSFLQDALADAESNPSITEIRVAQGTYQPDKSSDLPLGSGLRDATFQLPPGLALRGGYAGVTNPNARDPIAYPTILTGDLQGNDQPTWVNHGDNAYHVVTAAGVGSSTVLDGFTIRGGYATYGSSGAGGGIHLTNASPTIVDCTIDQCLAYLGAGLFANGGAPAITGCSFVGNYAWGGRGGALYFGTPTSPTITDCAFTANQAYGAGGPGDGGAAFLDVNCPALFDHCTFSSNICSTSSLTLYPNGGAVTSLADNVHFNGCRFLHNAAPLGAGGAIWSAGDGVVFSSCEFLGNTTKVGGAAAIFLSANVEFVNCTIAGNAAGDGGGLSLTYSTTADITNCILWANTATAASPYKAAIHKDDTSDATITWTCIQSMWVPEPGEDPLDPANFPGCTDADPLFVDANGPDNQYGTADDDCRLSAGSPLIDAAKNAAVPVWTTMDVAGLPRFTDDPATADTGVGTAPLVDFGAHEFGVPVVFGDINGDGLVDGADLGLLLGAWGSDDPAADLNGDGIVDGADLGLLLGAWTG